MAENPGVLQVSYRTSRFGPPDHVVTIRVDRWDWQEGPMTPTEQDGETWDWQIQVDFDQDPHFEFKLFLDGEHWMAGWNQSGNATYPPLLMSYNDDNVVWEGI